MTLHYKKERYVCCSCDDCPSWSDFMENLEVPPEETCDTGGQEITDQGGTPGLSSISDPDDVSDSGGVVNPPTPEPEPPVDECNEQWDYVGRGVYYGGNLLAVTNSHHLSGDLRSFTSGDSLAGVLQARRPHLSSSLTSRITIKKVVVRACLVTGTTCKVAIEAYKNDLPTGIVTPTVELVDDIAIGTGEVTYEIGDKLSWQPRFYDASDVEQTILPGDTVASFPTLTKGIIVAFEYETEDGYFFQHFSTDNIYSIINTDPSGTNRPLGYPILTNLDGEFAVDATTVQFPNGAGFNAEWELKRWIFEGWWLLNSQGSTHYLRYQDGTQLTPSAFEIFQQNPGDIFDPGVPRPYVLTGPYSEDIDAIIDPITESNIDTVGRVQVIEAAGDVTSFIGNGTQVSCSMNYSYKFTEHPHSQYILACYTSHTNVSVGAVRRVPLCGSYGTSQSAVRCATPLVTKGRFHHFAFWTQKTAAVGNLRCQLMVDNMVLFTLTIPAGGRLTTEAELSACVDGITAWWEFTKMSGSSEPIEVGVSCLYGPEGE